MDLDQSLAGVSCGGRKSSGHGSQSVVWALFVLIAATAWARGGSAVITPWLQFVLASLVVVVFLWEYLSGDFSGALGRLFRDPILYLGLGLLILMGIQWINAGRELYYDEGLKTWLYSQPMHSWLPFAFNADEAREVWIWFYCALVIVVVVRSSLVSRNGLYRLWTLIIANSCLLGLFGIVQFLSGTDRIFFIKHLPYQRFFASFGYSNHAGSYFVLVLFLCMAMFVRRLFKHEPVRFTFRAFLLLAAGLLHLFCANLTLSRFAILISWVGVTGFAVYVGRRLWRHGGPAVKINLGVGLVCCGFAALYASFSAAGSLLGKELVTFLRLQDDFLGSGRMMIFRAGLSVWQESPVFGVGPWGFRHLVGLHLDEAMHFLLMPGSASLHNDALQYLVESGLIGLGLMAAIFILLVWRVTPRRLKDWAPGMFLYGGIAVIVIQSMFDLPLRSPAVFYCWLAILAGSNKIFNEKLCSKKAYFKEKRSVSDCVNERQAEV